MKRILWAFMAVISLCLVGCGSDDNNNEEKNDLKSLIVGKWRVEEVYGWQLMERGEWTEEEYKEDVNRQMKEHQRIAENVTFDEATQKINFSGVKESEKREESFTKDGWAISKDGKSKYQIEENILKMFITDSDRDEERVEEWKIEKLNSNELHLRYYTLGDVAVGGEIDVVMIYKRVK